MGRQVHSWQSGEPSRLWLSMLVDAMEQAARPEIRSLPCDAQVLAALRAQLALPPPVYPCGTAVFSLRN